MLAAVVHWVDSLSSPSFAQNVSYFTVYSMANYSFVLRVWHKSQTQLKYDWSVSTPHHYVTKSVGTVPLDCADCSAWHSSESFKYISILYMQLHGVESSSLCWSPNLLLLSTLTTSSFGPEGWTTHHISVTLMLILSILKWYRPIPCTIILSEGR
jgi:hypothetical protein